MCTPPTALHLHPSATLQDCTPRPRSWIVSCPRLWPCAPHLRPLCFPLTLGLVPAPAAPQPPLVADLHLPVVLGASHMPCPALPCFTPCRHRLARGADAGPHGRPAAGRSARPARRAHRGWPARHARTPRIARNALGNLVLPWLPCLPRLPPPLPCLPRLPPLPWFWARLVSRPGYEAAGVENGPEAAGDPVHTRAGADGHPIQPGHLPAPGLGPADQGLQHGREPCSYGAHGLVMG